MNSKKVFQMEMQLYKECKEYIMRESTPRNEILEACVKAFCSVQEYRKILESAEEVNTNVKADCADGDSKLD